MSAIAYITNASQYSGVGHRAARVLHGLQHQYTDTVQPIPYAIDGEQGVILKGDRELLTNQAFPGILGSKSIQWIRLGNALQRSISDDSYGLYHCTNQTLSFLAKRLKPTVVTVHDIIEVTDPQKKSAYWVNKYLYGGITKADRIISVSQYTSTMLQQHYGIPAERIHVIPNGVDDTFRPIANFKQTVGYQQLLTKLNLPAEPGPIILYVGSDHPRKNVPVALRAFAKLHKTLDTAVFVKVGKAGIGTGREALLATASDLGVRDAIRIIDEYIDDEMLNEMYNLADVFIYPSAYEGFGLPPLQAMAAGLPVICSNATSLPEVVGDAAMQYEPDDAAGIAAALETLLTDTKKATQYTQVGIKQASKFSWDTCVQNVIRVYEELL